MKYLTRQQIFNKVANHLLAQGRQSRGIGDLCAYLGEDGRKCAVGCLIHKKHYNPMFERAYAASISKSSSTKARALKRALKKSNVNPIGGTLDLLIALQEMHDQSPASCWRTALVAMAEEFKLSTRWIKE